MGVGPLNNGTPYTLRLRAVNGVGNSPVAVANSATPATVPAAPALNSMSPATAS